MLWSNSIPSPSSFIITTQTILGQFLHSKQGSFLTLSLFPASILRLILDHIDATRTVSIIIKTNTWHFGRFLGVVSYQRTLFSSQSVNHLLLLPPTNLRCSHHSLPSFAKQRQVNSFLLSLSWGYDAARMHSTSAFGKTREGFLE